MDLSAWAPYVEAMSAFHRGDRDAYMVVYDDYERDEVPLAYFFRDSTEFPEVERLALDLCRGRLPRTGGRRLLDDQGLGRRRPRVASGAQWRSGHADGCARERPAFAARRLR